MPIQYHDFDLLIERQGDGFKARVIDSPAGEATAQITLPFTQTDVENFYIQIGHTRLFETSQMQKMRVFGQELFEATFTGNVRDKFRESLSEVNRKREGLRIRLRLADVPELANMPWEFMYDTSLSRFLALSVETPLVRYLDVPRDIQPLTVHPPLKILAVISSPRNFPTLNVQREWDNLKEALSRLESRELVRVTRLEKPTLQALQRQLRRDEFHIFHFIGHGIFSKQYQDGQLLFEDELKGGDPVSSRDLGILLHDHRQLRLAVLNACEGARTSIEDQFSGTAQSLIQQGLPAVIAMQFRITDIAAITLAREFYAALADGYPVDASLTEARKSIKTHGNELEWGTPVLYMRSPNGQIFDVESIKQTPRPTVQSAAIPDLEAEKQIANLYTEGLEAFYLKEWEIAIIKFKSILAVQGDHKDSAAKIKIAQHELKLSSLDEQAKLAESKGDWASAVKALEALVKELPEEPSLLPRLENIRKQLRLKNLYAEAQQLAKAKKWLAVVQVFKEIHSMDSGYPDSDNLLPAAQDAAEAQKAQIELESLYQKALQAIDTNDWYAARDTLKIIRSKQENYRQTEKLIQRAEGEIANQEIRKQEQEQVASLYLQAENLASRKQWKKALEKIEEILKLQPGFEDPGQIAKLARSEIEKVQEETDKQDQLATLYAEAVQFTQAGEYQKALDQWNQIRVLDTTYPDKQKVQATASKMLRKVAQPESDLKKLTWRPTITLGSGILFTGVLWYTIRLGALSIAGLFETNNIAISQLIHWSIFGIVTALLNLLAILFFKLNISNKRKLILVAGWFVSSLATPMMVWLFPEFRFRFDIGYTLTGFLYGLVLHYALPDFRYRPKLSTLLFAFTFGFFIGGCSYTWFSNSAGIAAPHYSALALGTAGLIVSSFAFSKTIEVGSDTKTKATLEKTALSIAGILIASRWLGSVIGDRVASIILDPAGISWETAPYPMLNMWYGLFAFFAAWFLFWFLKNKLLIPITKKEIAILFTSWIAGMVTTSFLCIYLGIDLGHEWGWRVGWGVGGLIIGLGMWLATRSYSHRNKQVYLITSILGWGFGFYFSEQISGPLQEFFIHFFGDALGRNIAVNANVGFAGLVGGLILASQLEIGHERNINWKTVFASTLGFSIGVVIVNTIFYNSDRLLVLQFFLWGAIGSATLAFPSKDYKKYLILASIGGFGLALGNQVYLSLDRLSFNIVVWGIFGLILGIYSKNFYKACIIGIFAPLIYNARWGIKTLFLETIRPTHPAIDVAIDAGSALVLGLLIGIIWSFLVDETIPSQTKEVKTNKSRIISFDTSILNRTLKALATFLVARTILEIVFSTLGLFEFLEKNIGVPVTLTIYFACFGFLTGTAIWLTFARDILSPNRKSWLLFSLVSASLFAVFLMGSHALQELGNWVWTTTVMLIGAGIGLTLARSIRKKTLSAKPSLYWQLSIIWGLAYMFGQLIMYEINFLMEVMGFKYHTMASSILETGIFGLIGSLFTLLLIRSEQIAQKKSILIAAGTTVILFMIIALTTGLQGIQRNFVQEQFVDAVGNWKSQDSSDGSHLSMSIRRNIVSGQYTITYRDSYSVYCMGPAESAYERSTMSNVISPTYKFFCPNLPLKNISNLRLSYNYNSVTDTISDTMGNFWGRK